MFTNTTRTICENRPSSSERSATVDVCAVTGVSGENRPDFLAVEEPLEIRITHGRDRITRSLSITMRTPGHDAELAAGFLFAEGIVPGGESILGIDTEHESNVVHVELRPEVVLNLDRTKRNFTMSSSCGVCGKTTLDSLAIQCQFLPTDDFPIIPAAWIHELPRRLRESQATFDRTGGLHAAGLFDTTGELLALREDVGRHNAVDKLIGAELLANRIPLSNRILVVSGRASFELMQKAMMAGIPILAAVGAPSSLAVDLARQFGLTLLGFVRDGRFNIYTGAGRIGLGS